MIFAIISSILFVIIAPFAMRLSAEFNHSFREWQKEDKENKNEDEK